MNTIRNRTCIALCALTLTAVFSLSGCGGGGGGTQNKTLVGTLLDSNKAPLTDTTVVYDAGTTASQTTVTDVHGQYRLVLSMSAITGADTLAFYDAAGHLVDQVPVTLKKDTQSIAITTVTPPAPPVQSL